MIVKICGITRPLDAARAATAGADLLGINFWPGSRRFVRDANAAETIAVAARDSRPGIGIVGVFVDQDVAHMEAVADQVGLDFVQLHGDEPEEVCARFGDRAIKAFRLGGDADAVRAAEHPGDTVLVNTPTAGFGGSGATFDWALARIVVESGKRVLLAGGLHPDNVRKAVAAVSPYGVDVASGVESAPGIKDDDRVCAFIRAAKGDTP